MLASDIPDPDLYGWMTDAAQKHGRAEHVIRKHTEPGSDAPPAPFYGTIEDFIREYDAQRIAAGKPVAGPGSVVIGARNAGFPAGVNGLTERAIKETAAAIRTGAPLPPAAATHAAPRVATAAASAPRMQQPAMRVASMPSLPARTSTAAPASRPSTTLGAPPAAFRGLGRR